MKCSKMKQTFVTSQQSVVVIGAVYMAWPKDKVNGSFNVRIGIYGEYLLSLEKADKLHRVTDTDHSQRCQNKALLVPCRVQSILDF